MMKINKYIIIGITMIMLSILMTGCNDSKSETNSDSLSFVYNFNNVSEGFTSNKADVPIGYSDLEYEFLYNLEELEMKGNSNKALSLEYNNKNEDMFVYVFKELNESDGIEPNMTYDVKMKFDIGTNLNKEDGEKTFVKAGVIGRLPLPEEKTENIELNIDKGNGKEEGTDLKTLEGITKPNVDSKDYELKSYTLDTTVTSNSEGMVYAFVGVDSELSKKIKFYIDNVSLKFEKIKEE